MPYLTPDMPPANSFICRRLYIPNEPEFVRIVNGALSELTIPFNYEQFGDLTAEETAQFFTEMWLKYKQSEGCMIGMVTPFVTVNVPPNCLECDGSIYDRVDYPDLYAVIHPDLIIDPDTFRTPNLVSRFVLGGTGDFGAQPAHETLGEAEVTLTEGQMPAHTHTNTPHSHTTIPHAHTEIVAVAAVVNGGVSAPAPSAIPAPGVTGFADVTVNAAGVSIDSAGSSEPHNNMPPAYTLRYCVIAR